jgi:methionyl-tRNA synthetase
MPGIAEANILIWRLLDNSDAEEADGYQVACDECAALVSEDVYSENDGLCNACNAAVHFTCEACGEEQHVDDRSEEYPTLCVSCGSDKHTKAADNLWSELEDLAGSWSGEDCEISNLKKLLAYAKRLRKD